MVKPHFQTMTNSSATFSIYIEKLHGIKIMQLSYNSSSI